METKEIIESGFVKSFIAEYVEDKIYSFYPDKDRLLYVLCSTDLEKQQVTVKQIEIVKTEIQKLGNEELSFAYLLSCKPDNVSGHNYIEPDQRFDFWLNRFFEEFVDRINTFTPIIDACKLFKTKISNEDFENEFWNIYPASQKPKENFLPLVIQREIELLNEIEFTISEYRKNEYWEFDFEEYQKYIDTSKPIELLFNLSELLVQLYRLEMFNEFLLPPHQTETKTDRLKVKQIALIHFYNGIQITRENAGEIAAKHGYTAKNSGEGLFQDYTYYCSTANRKAKPTPFTAARLNNKIKLFESVIPFLSDNNEQRAIDEINILKTIYENEYQ
jgi:hypothetical protein